MSAHQDQGQDQDQLQSPLRSSPEPIAIVGGTGNLGFGLALRFAQAGHPVHIGSRDADRAGEAAARANHLLEGAARLVGSTNAEAVAAAERLVIITVPFSNQISTLKSLTEHWREGQIALDATVPLATAFGGRPTQLVQPWSGSAAEQARTHIPDQVAVVAGLHTISAAALMDLEHGLDQDTLVCGPNSPAKTAVLDLLSGVNGLRAIDAGPLSTSRLVEGVTPLLIGINIRHKTHAGIRVTNLPG